MIRMSRRICLGILCMTWLVLSSCGFHLRSASEIPPELKVVYLETPNSNSGFTSQLKNMLTSMDVQIVNQRDAASYTLKITDISFGHGGASILSLSTPTAYTYSYSFSYSIITNKGHVVIAPTSVGANDTIYAAPDQMLTSNSTDKRMQQQLQTEALSQFFNSLTSYGVIKEVRACHLHPHRCVPTISS